MSQDAERFAASASETVQLLANEPSVGLYYVTEHVQRSVIELAGDKARLRKATEVAKGLDMDAGFALAELDATLSGATQSAFSNTLRLARLSANIVDKPQ